ncbi:MAG: ribonuclease P protein component, partial [Patescibacteria group bacterium]|nr:ribonuclease P protein component [Patescibacteria group bacterium]
KEKFLFVKIKNNGMDLNRFGFIVSKKVSKKAVIRNKIKRRLREIIKARIAKMKQGYDIIILVYPEIKEKSFLEIENIVDKIFKKVKLL